MKRRKATLIWVTLSGVRSVILCMDGAVLPYIRPHAHDVAKDYHPMQNVTSLN